MKHLGDVCKIHDAEPVWASEIEEFPIAVTKKHFQEKGNENEPDKR